MKKTKKIGLRSMILLVFLFACLGMACPADATPAHKFIASTGACAFRSPSGDYRQIYGNVSFMPEVKLTCLVFKDISLWGSAGLFTDKGFIEEVEEDASYRRTVLGVGVGYVHELNASLRLRGELGLAAISYREEAMDVVNKGSGLGWRAGANLDYLIGKRLFLFLAAAYSQASDEAETGTIKLGGAQVGAGLGVSF